MCVYAMYHKLWLPFHIRRVEGRLNSIKWGILLDKTAANMNISPQTPCMGELWLSCFEQDGTEMQLYIYTSICWDILTPLGLMVREYKLLLGLSSLSAQGSFRSGLSLLPPAPLLHPLHNHTQDTECGPAPLLPWRYQRTGLRNRDQFFGIFSMISTILGKYGNRWQWSMVMINDNDILIKSRGSRFSIRFMPLF